MPYTAGPKRPIGSAGARGLTRALEQMPDERPRRVRAGPVDLDGRANDDDGVDGVEGAGISSRVGGRWALLRGGLASRR